MSPELVLPLKEKIVEKLNDMSEDDLSEVMDFLEFLAWKAQQPQVANMKSISTAEALRALRGHGRSEQLVERLLEARQADRTIDERSHALLLCCRLLDCRTGHGSPGCLGV